jgi:hypothetical protein
MTPQERARIHSLEWHLSDWDEDLTYDDILDILRSEDPEGVIVWQPLESLGGEYVADSIERLTEEFLEAIWWRQ